MIDIVVIAPSDDFEEILEALRREYEIIWVVYDTNPPLDHHKATVTLNPLP